MKSKTPNRHGRIIELDLAARPCVVDLHAPFTHGQLLAVTAERRSPHRVTGDGTQLLPRGRLPHSDHLSLVTLHTSDQLAVRAVDHIRVQRRLGAEGWLSG